MSRVVSYFGIQLSSNIYQSSVFIQWLRTVDDFGLDILTDGHLSREAIIIQSKSLALSIKLILDIK